jgi:hypothetical protein
MMYYVFAGADYYPLGGGSDLQYFSDDLNDAISHAVNKLNNRDWVQVYGSDDVEGLALEWSRENNA